jgi:hypothetical protein
MNNNTLKEGSKYWVVIETVDGNKIIQIIGIDSFKRREKNRRPRA